MNYFFSKFVLIVFVTLLTGCAVGPGYQRPETAVNELKQYINAPEVAGDVSMAQWWTRLDDPVVDQLVEQVLSKNFNIIAASERVIQARENVAATRGGFWPSLAGNASASRTATGTNSRFGFTAPRNYTNTFEAGLSSNWQIDVFGKIRQSVARDRASFLATQADREALAQLLISDLVRQRVAVATLARRLDLARDIAKSRDNTVQIVQRRYNNGVDGTNALDIRLARENYASAKANIPGLESDLTDALYGVDILLGVAPGATKLETINFAPLPPQQKIIVPPPAELLDRRPDLRASELRLKAANSSVGLAIADLYPDVSLGGTLGFQDNGRPNNLFTADQLGWSLLSNVTANLFEGGRLRANINISKSRARELAADYSQSVLEALRDVESALQRTQKIDQEVALIENNVEEARQAETIAQDRYTRGIATLLQLLETQRRRQIAEQNLLLTQQEAWNTRIDLYLSLGGDWQTIPVLDENGV